MSIPRKPTDKGLPIHPDEFLREDFMKPRRMTSASLAAALKVPARNASAIVSKRGRMSAEIATRLRPSSAEKCVRPQNRSS